MQTYEVALGEKSKKTSGKITDRVKTFHDAYRELGISPDATLSITSAAEELKGDLLSIAAYTKLIIIARALNEGWTPNWTDENERKWYPWFILKTGFGFSRTFCVGWHTGTDVGSRLCFKSEALATYAGKQFEAIYNDFITL